MAITSHQPLFPTCNGKEFTDRLFGLRKRAATGAHEFDKLCTELGIHRISSMRDLVRARKAAVKDRTRKRQETRSERL